MKILHVVPYIPALNSNGGAWRMFSILKGLADRGHEVSVLSFANTESEVELALPLRDFCHQVEVIVRRPSYGIRNYLTRGFLDNDFYSTEFRDTLLEMLDRTDYDVVHYKYYQMSPYIQKSSRKAIVFSDLESPFLVGDRNRMDFGFGNFMLKSQLLARTQRVLNIADQFISVTDNDAEALKKEFVGAQPVVVNTGINLDFFRPNKKVGDPKKLIFVGYFLHPPNVDAMCNFVRNILPIVWEKEPDIELSIVGKDPTSEVLALRSKRVHVTGFVPDIRPLMKDAGIFIVPIRVGAGFRGKILEAWAMGLPVVSTTIAADGFVLRPNDNIVIADTSIDFANAIVTLVNDKALREKVGLQGRQTAEQLYGWDSKIKLLESIYDEALSIKSKGLT